MPAAQHNFTIEAGADFDVALTLEQPAGTPVDLTGASPICMDVRDRAGGALIVALSLANGRIEITDATAGKLRLIVAGSVTEALSGHGRYDLFVTFPSGAVKKYLRGNVEIIPAVTDC